MTYTEFLQQFSLQNVYILFGDVFLADRCKEYIRDRLDIASDYDITIFDSENFSADALIESCEQISFFAKSRLSVVKNISSVTEKDKQKLLAYIKDVNPYCTILFYDTLRTGVFDFLQVEKVNLVLGEFEIKNIVKKQVENFDKKIDDDALLCLITFCQKDLFRINLEIEKLVAYTNQRDVITLNDIEQLVPQTEELVVFELTSAMAQKNTQKSLEILCKLLGNQEQNSRLFALLSTTLRRMFFVLASKDKSDIQLANIFGVKEFAVKKLRTQSKNFAITTLKNLVYELCEVEYMTKNGQMTYENALYYIIQKSQV